MSDLQGEAGSVAAACLPLCSVAWIPGFFVTADNCVHVEGLLTFIDLTFPHTTCTRLKPDHCH